MEDRRTSSTSQCIGGENPPYFHESLQNLWGIFEKQLRENEGALQMLNVVSNIISSDQTFEKMEHDFKLGKLGEYASAHEETLPFLATIINHFHQQLEESEKESNRRNEGSEVLECQRLERRGSKGQNTTANAERQQHCFSHAMTSFLKDLELNLGSNEKTELIVTEIAEKVSQAAHHLEIEQPTFAKSLNEIGICVRNSWLGLSKDVEECIRRVRKKRYSDRSMQKIYTRIISKGIKAAQNIQSKIQSVSSAYEPRAAEAETGNYRYEDEMNKHGGNVGG